MIIDNCYVITVETAEEVKAANEAILKIREERQERQRKEAIQKCKMAISFEVSNAISEIGLEEVKRIVREINHELRESGA